MFNGLLVLAIVSSRQLLPHLSLNLQPLLHLFFFVPLLHGACDMLLYPFHTYILLDVLLNEIDM